LLSDQHQSDHHQMLQQGYLLLKNGLSSMHLNGIEQEYQRLCAMAQQIITEVDHSGQSWAQYYLNNGAALISVPERSQPQTLCRFEYVTGLSSYFAEQIVPILAAKIESVIGQPVNLFKDKCNLKSPGGGAFSCHQDIPAYIDFGPDIHITAAVIIDPATANNGALEVAENYLQVDTNHARYIPTGLGEQPMFDFYQGGNDNGTEVDEAEQLLQYQPIYTQPGDVLLFNSFVPHRSEVNRSADGRRAFFFTFNLASQGDHYERYYQSKRGDFGNPRFHVATPTRHSACQESVG
jgi:hypothetical protein